MRVAASRTQGPDSQEGSPVRQSLVGSGVGDGVETASHQIDFRVHARELVGHLLEGDFLVALRADQHDFIAQARFGIEIGDVDREHVERDAPDDRAALAMDQDDALVEQRPRVAFAETDRQRGDLAVALGRKQAAVSHGAPFGTLRS